MEEKRKYIRWKVPAKIFEDWDIPTKVNYRIAYSIVKGEALCRDIATMGMKLRLNKQLLMGTALTLKIDLPDYPRPVFVQGEISWHKEVEEQGKRYYEVGVRFSKIKDSDKQRIYNFVFDLGQDEVANRWWKGFGKIGEMGENKEKSA